MKTKRISERSALVAVATFACACLTANAQDFRILHHLTGGTNDGSGPTLGRLVQSGAVLYGMTWEGGTSNNGVVFRLSSDGAGFQILHSFASASSDGQKPIGSLLLSGNTLYGIATSENTSYGGTLFRIGTDGAGFQVLHTFPGNGAQGKWPYEAPILLGTNFLGFAHSGGSAGKGTVYRMSTNGSACQVLHSFTDTPDGSLPHGTPLLIGSILYGTTLGGGSNGDGTIFKINTDGSGYSVLHHFTGNTGDGAACDGTLIQVGSNLCGVTVGGGAANKGAVFRINTNGTAFQLLHSFNGTDGWAPHATLASAGSTLYGMTGAGGSSSNGVVFSVNANSSQFRLLHTFAGGTADGSVGMPSLMVSGSTLYGMTSAGGSNNLGVIFALDLLPKLSIGLSDTNVNLSWSTNYPGFTLESTGDLTGGWTTVPGATGYFATLPVSANSQFFRLKQ